ncbi:MAG: T9SS type A sorting domain-containing protein [Bacteroidales bacterium]
MKKLFTFFLVTTVTCSLFSQPPKTVLYLTSEIPFQVGVNNKNDQIMFDIIKDLGYDVTAENVNATPAVTSGYDVAFLSENIGSGEAGWLNYKTAPLPMVVCKVFAIKGDRLGWVAGTGSGDDYGNSNDSVMVKLNDHPIASGLPDEFQISENAGESVSGAWVDFKTSDPTNATYVYDMKTPYNAGRTTEHAVVAIDQGGTANGVTLANRAVILGIHQVVYDALTDNAIKLIDNCLKWAMRYVSDIDEKADMNSTSIYPNPVVNGNINFNFGQSVQSGMITITSIEGKLLKSEEIMNSEKMSFDVSDLSQGLYIVKVQSANVNKTQTIVIR